MTAGQTSLALPPTFIFCSASVQHLITPFTRNCAGRRA